MGVIPAWKDLGSKDRNTCRPDRCYGGNSYKIGWEQCWWCVGLLHVGLDPQTERTCGVQQPALCISSPGWKCWGKQYEEWKKPWAHKFMKTSTCDYAKCKVWLNICVFSLGWHSHDYKQPEINLWSCNQFVIFFPILVLCLCLPANRKIR